MKILAIRFARLGDVVLLLPALARLKDSFPDSRLTFLTGHRCASIAELCPAIDEVISVDRIALRDGPILEAVREMGRLVGNIRRRRFDLVVDFHSFRETNLLTWLSGAPRRMGMKRYEAPYLSFCFNLPPVMEDKGLHVGEMFHRVVDAVCPSPPQRGGVARGDRNMGSDPSWQRDQCMRELSLQREGSDPIFLSPRAGVVIPDHLRQWAQAAMPPGPRLVLYVDAPVLERIWPPAHFAQVADFAIEKFGVTVAVISGIDGKLLAESVRRSSRHAAQLSLFTEITAAQLAALIASARLLISNDTGPMHIGPAVGIPTLGLFSVGYPEHFRPTGPRDRFLRANPIENIQVKEVTEAAEQMWTAGS